MQRTVYSDKQLVDIIRRSILAGKYKPRERLVEAALSEEYHVSRTPVREAIKQLEAMGLVVRERNKGAMVADIDLNRIHEMQVVRAALEGFATKLAAPRLTSRDLLALERFVDAMEEAAHTGDIETYSRNNIQFHDYIYNCCGNAYLISSIDNILKCTVHRPTATWVGMGDVDLVNRRHREILEALKTGDAERARQTAEEHVQDAIALQAQNMQRL